MKVLVIKTSSLGDVLHTLPALTDAREAIPEVRFDWVVEEAFARIPGWHPAVDQVIPVAVRRWRKKWWSRENRRQWSAFKQHVRQQHYDAVIDAQGLIKSAALCRPVSAPCYGLGWHSAREPLASLAYNYRLTVDKNQHAIDRVRQLFAQVLNYPVPSTTPDYAIRGHFSPSHEQRDYLVFLHGTTWATKHWPEDYWQQLIALTADSGHRVKLPWGNAQEHERASRLAQGQEHVEVLAKTTLDELATILAGSRAVVAVDTGIGHLAAALDVPCISLYGATDPARTGTRGNHQQHLAADFDCAPCLQRNCSWQGQADVSPACYSTVTADRVWQHLQALIGCE